MFREILRKSATYSLAIIGSRLAGMLMLPVYTRYLNPADYGVLELLDVTVNIVGLLIGSRIGQALYYFYFAAETESERQACVSTTLIGAAIVGLAFAAISSMASGPLSLLVFGTSQYAPYLFLALTTFGLSLALESGYSYMRMLQFSASCVRAALTNTFLAVGLSALLLVVFRMGLKGMLIGGLASTAVVTAYVLWFGLHDIPIRLNLGLLRRILVFSLPLGVSALSVFLVHYGDRIFLRTQVSLAQIGIYSLAYKMGMMISFVHAPFFQHWLARVSAIVRDRDGERIYVKTFTYLTLVLTSATVMLILFVQPALRILTTPAFHAAGALVPCIGLAYLLRALGAHVQGLFNAEGKPNAELRANGLGAVVCLISYALLIPRFKLWGAASATLITFLVILVYSFWEAQRIRYYHFEYGRLLRIAAIAILTVGAFYLVQPSGFVAELGVGFGLLGFYLGAIVFGCLSREERTSGVSALRAALKSLGVAGEVAAA